MTLITRPQDAEDAEALLRASQAALRDLRETLEEIRAKARSGEDMKTADAKTAVTAMDPLIRSCLKLETFLVETKYKEAGIATGGYALDLDAARAEIGRRLDRLRLTRDTGGLS